MNEKDKLNLITNYFADNLAIDKAMQLLDDYEKMVEAQQPVPSAAAAGDSVLEDAVRLWEAFIEAWRNEIGVDKIVNIMGGADKLKAVFLDAARKQG